jgi:hypothetical protein
MKNLFILLLIVSSFSGFSQNGYTLEFETTILLSHDTTAMIPQSTIKIKQYTVPAGMVLKINSGMLSDYIATHLTLQTSELIVGNQIIKSPFLGSAAQGIQQVSTIIGGGLEGVQPIWANEGTLVQLKFAGGASGNFILPSIRGCWIGGILFRKIPN